MNMDWQDYGAVSRLQPRTQIAVDVIFACNLILPGVIQIQSVNAEMYLLFIVLVGTFAIDISLTPFWRCYSRGVRNVP